MYFFSADYHLGHKNIIRYCNRPFDSVEEMDETIIANHNKVVKPTDIFIHAGDLTLIHNKSAVYRLIRRLNGRHIFLKGSHDYWMDNSFHEIWEKSIDGQRIVACHYAMRTWPASHHNSWHVYGHSHRCLTPEGKSWDVGVDNNNFFPVSFEELKEIMKNRPDNFNLIRNAKTY